MADIVRGQFRNAGGNVGLHLLGQALVFQGLPPLLTKLVERLAEIIFHLLVTAKLGADLINPVIQLAGYHIVVHLQRVNARLHEEQLRLQDAFQHLATHILIRNKTLLDPRHLDFLFQLADRHHFIADHGDGFIDKSLRVVLGLGAQGGEGRNSGQDHFDCLHIQYIT